MRPPASRFAALLFALGACSDSQPAEPSPSIVFSYPVDGQIDVPTGARLIVGFSSPLDSGAVGDACTETSGSFCVVGPAGVVSGTVTLADQGAAVHFTGDFLPGTRYEVWVRPTLSPSAVNLNASEPLFSFTTRSSRPRSGQAPFVVAINGEVVERFPVAPLVDFATLRVLLSEPVSRTSLVYGDSVALLDAQNQLVDAVMVSDGQRISLDPKDDLAPGQSYRLRLTSAIRDTGGEAFVDFEKSFEPLDSRGEAGLVRQTLRSSPEAVSGSQHFGVAPNTIEIAKPLLGVQTLNVGQGSISAELGDPSLLGGPIPMTIRRGQELSSVGLEIKFGGEVASNVETGVTGVRFVTDATGFLFRNPFRAAAEIPHDVHAPIFFRLAFDIALVSSESTGNAVVSQNVLHAQTSGTAVVRDGVLILETVGAIDVDILGVSTGDGNLALLLAADNARTPIADDQSPPTLVSSYPFAGQTNFPPSARAMLLFNEPVDDSVADQVELSVVGGGPVAVWFESIGGALLLEPTTPLAYGTDYEISIRTTRDLAGNPAAQESIRFSTPIFAASAVAPALTALRPGAPCALNRGQCVAGLVTDSPYGVFQIGPDEPAEAYITQPIQPESVVLGASCGSGSVRVEELDASGACRAVVPGALSVVERGFRFVPAERWESGVSYRLTVVGGANDSCDAGEICGINGRALNTDVLSASGGGSGGGPDIRVEFVVNEAAYPGAYIPIELTPFTDENGSGFVAAGQEEPRAENRVVFELASISGIISDARFTDSDCVPETPAVEGCLYLSGTVPILLEEPQADCTIAMGANGPITAETCVPLILTPQIFFGTSANMEADVLLLTPSVTIGQVILRILDRPGTPSRAFIYEKNGETRLGGDLELYVDAPNLDISVPGSGHDLRSRLLAVSLDGPVTFFDDGRVRINMSNTLPIDLAVAVDFLNIGLGGIGLKIPVGGLTLQLVSPLIRSGDR